MPFNWKPVEFEQIAPGVFVTKHPAVHSVQVESAPIFLVSPVEWFIGMSVTGVVVLFAIHPTIQAAEDFFSHSYAEIVGPSPDDRVELGNDDGDARPFRFVPFLP